MANFTDVINIINRMQLEMESDLRKMRKKMTAYPEQVEQTARQRAKDNPIPRYPSWAEWLCEMGVSRVIEDENGRPKYIKTRKFYSDMDADVAEKLGIEPKIDK